MKFGVVVFPGANCDDDCFHVVKNVLNQPVVYLWHKETDLQQCDCIILPGGFSYGDYLRTGAVAKFSPIMNSVNEHAKKGKPVIGICNGFQILLESGLLKGAMLRNTTLKFICKFVNIRVENNRTAFTKNCKAGDALRIPIAHNEGNYYADEDTLKQIQDDDCIVFKYCDADGNVASAANPNGSVLNIAGISNKEKNVVGMMPHPERCSEEMLGSIDGRIIFESVII